MLLGFKFGRRHKEQPNSSYFNRNRANNESVWSTKWLLSGVQLQAVSVWWVTMLDVRGRDDRGWITISCPQTMPCLHKHSTLTSHWLINRSLCIRTGQYVITTPHDSSTRFFVSKHFIDPHVLDTSSIFFEYSK